jgi:hypothetical protein
MDLQGLEDFNENTVEKTIKIDFSQHPLDETQFYKRKPIREVLPYFSHSCAPGMFTFWTGGAQECEKK